MSREKVPLTEISKAMRAAAKAGLKVHSYERRADGFVLHFDPEAVPADKSPDQNEWDAVK